MIFEYESSESGSEYRFLSSETHYVKPRESKLKTNLEQELVDAYSIELNSKKLNLDKFQLKKRKAIKFQDNQPSVSSGGSGKSNELENFDQIDGPKSIFEFEWPKLTEKETSRIINVDFKFFRKVNIGT